MNADFRQGIMDEVNNMQKKVIGETLTSISVSSELNNSTKVLDKLDEISNKLSELIDAISVMSLQTVTTNKSETVQYMYPDENITTQVSGNKQVTKPVKKDKPFIPQIDTSEMNIKLNDSKTNTKSSSKNIMDSLDALNKLK